MNIDFRKLTVFSGALLPVVLLLGTIVPGSAIAGASGQPPSASAVMVSEILSTTATLNGVPNPQGELTLAWFEYGTTSAYGSRTPGQDLGSGTAPVPISAPLSGLDPDTTYHVRLDVQSASATVDGPDSSFTTTAPSVATTLPPSPPSGSLVSMKVDDNRTKVSISGVSCTGPKSCWAVGDLNGSMLVEEELAGVWSPVSIPSSPPGADLMGIDCLSVSSCWAVGGYGGASTFPLSMHFNGRSWTRIPIADAPGSFGVNELTSVNCPSAADCWAVGISDSPSPETRRLIEHWNGRAWSVESSPDPDPGGANYLSSVSCSSANSCWAVGDERASSALVMHWNGTSWTRVSSPARKSLAAISCEWLSACFAVGETGGTLRLVSGVWHTVTPLQPSSTTPQFFSAVSCSGPESCWSVGFRYEGNGIQALESAAAESWNGTSWAAATVQVPVGVLEFFSDVACVAGQNCVAIGEYETSRSGNPFRFFADQTIAIGSSS